MPLCLTVVDVRPRSGRKGKPARDLAARGTSVYTAYSCSAPQERAWLHGRYQDFLGAFGATRQYSLQRELLSADGASFT